jgi:hypothetical protein
LKQLKRNTEQLIETIVKRMRQRPALAGLISLLNAEPGTTTFRDTKLSPAQQKQTLDALSDLQHHLIELLTPLSEPHPKERRASECLRRLIEEINSRDLKPGFYLHQGTVHQSFYAPFTADNDAEDTVSGMYSNLATVLVSGEIRLLRRCPYCGKFFMAVIDRRARFCPGHGRLYYDDPSRAKERVYKSRSK